MTRRVAGRADGRPNTSAPRTTPAGGRREGGRRLALGALATVVTGLLGVPAIAHAAPGDPDSSTGSSADRPLELTVSRLEPRTVTPGAAVEVTATLRNDSTETYDDLEVRLQRGEVLTTRSGLAADLARPGDHTAATTPFLEVPGVEELEPGDTHTFSYSTPAEALQLTADGVYPLLLNVNGTRADGVTERAAELATHLVVQPAVPDPRTQVAWLWPVTDRPHRDATGAFTDDGLAAQVDDGGRLDRIVETVEQLPRTTDATSAETVPAVPVTLAVDPALLEELAAMAAGPYLVDGEEGTGTADAAALLERLRRLAADHDVVALPYADVDADALVAAGEGEALLRTLPGAGTVRQPSTADGALVPTPAAGTTPTGAGAAVIEEVLGVQPRTDLAWPAGGTLDEGTVTTLATGGIGTVVLAEDGLTDGSQAVGDDGDPAAARGVLETTGGPVTALVADGELAEAVETATLRPETGRLVEQRYLAELAALHSQQPDGAPATVLVAPPRWVDPDPGTVGAMMTDTATQPWLAPVSVAALPDGPAAEVGELTGTDPDVRLPAGTMAGIVETSGVRDDFAAAVVGDADEALAGYDAAIARAASAQWRGDPEAFQAAVTDLQGTVAGLREQVSLVSPADGTYTLASSEAPLVLTVRNDLPFAVDVRLDLQSRRNVGLVTEDIGVQTLAPESLTTIEVPADVQQSGGFAVTARLTTPAGGPLGEPVQLQVRSTAYGPVTLAITLGAAALLALLFLRRAVRFVLRRRRGEPAPTPDEAAGLPPARSPV